MPNGSLQGGGKVRNGAACSCACGTAYFTRRAGVCAATQHAAVQTCRHRSCAARSCGSPSIDGLARAVEDAAQHIPGHRGLQRLQHEVRGIRQLCMYRAIPCCGVMARALLPSCSVCSCAACASDHMLKTAADLASELQRCFPVVDARGALEHLHDGPGAIHLQHLTPPVGAIAQTDLHNLCVLGALQTQATFVDCS